MALMPVAGVRAQVYDENGQYVDTIFHDHINRQAEDFVKAYFCVAEPTDWRDDFLGVNGHAFIRLVCDTFHMDYCFSYESESTEGQMDKYLQGKLKMGMYAIPTEEYLVDFINWKRAVHQYKLNLPPNVKQRLWEILDGHVMEGDQLKLDLNKRGCAVTAVQYVKAALGDIQINYPSNYRYAELTRRDIIFHNMENMPWLRLVQSAVLQNTSNENGTIDENMFLPQEVAKVWQQSSLMGQPLIEYDCDIVEAPIVEVSAPLITPMLASLLCLLLTIILSFIPVCRNSWVSKVNTYVLLAMQVALGVALLYLALFTQMFSVSAGLLIVFFNPLPAIFWKWRQWWQLPVAIVYLLSIIILFAWPHVVVDPAYLILGLNYVVLFSSDTINQFCNSANRRK